MIHILPSCMSWWLSMRGTRLWRLPWQCIDVPQTNWRPAGLWWGGPNRPAKRGWGRGSVTRETLKKSEDQFKAGDMCWNLPLTTVHFKLFLILQCIEKNWNVHKYPVYFISHKQQFISNTFYNTLICSIYGSKLGFSRTFT